MQPGKGKQILTKFTYFSEMFFTIGGGQETAVSLQHSFNLSQCSGPVGHMVQHVIGNNNVERIVLKW
jgi:hypothetical protein